MKPVLLTLLLAPISLLSAQPDAAPASTAKVVDLRVEAQTNPASINTPLPRFSWRIETEERGWLQKSYQILVASSAELLAKDEGDLWDSGEIPGRASHLVQFGGAPLPSKQRAFWKVRLRSNKDSRTAWSPQGAFTTALAAPPSKLLQPFKKGAASLSSFECSDPKLNEIYAAAASRLHEIQQLRDVGIAMRPAAYHQALNPDISAWLDHLHASTDPAGFYPASFPSDGSFGSTQSDAAIVATHAHWWMTGDPSIFRRHIGTMKRYVFARNTLDPLKQGTPFGSLPPDTLPEHDPTPPEFVHFASQALNLRLLSDLGRSCSTDPYEMISVQNLQPTLIPPFEQTFLDESGRLKNGSLTSKLLALRGGLYTDPAAKKTAIEDLLREIDPSPKPGILTQSPTTIQHLLATLTLLGRNDLTLQIANSQMVSELSPVALAAISEWLIASLAGIDTEGAGFQDLRLAPQIPSPDQLDHVKAHYLGPNGRIEVEWKNSKGRFEFVATVPPNSVASVRLPMGKGRTMMEGKQPAADSPHLFGYQEKGGLATFKVLSGTYRFSSGD